MKSVKYTARSKTARFPPPLSQSRQGDMACERLYAEKHIWATKHPQSDAASRGIEVHQLLSTYINHLVSARRPSDLGMFDSLMRCVSTEAQTALVRFRDNHSFDPEKIVATELHIKLDEDFRPIEGVAGGDAEAAYEGTLDLVVLNSLTDAEIDDWKSYYQVIDADTFQSKLYPLLLMCLNPSIERVKFVLEFIRYGASRIVEYKRDDVPQLRELANRERRRQTRLHRVYSRRRDGAPNPSPGRHCTWCPLVLGGCPIAQSNPYSQMTAEERLRFAIWLQEAEKQNTGAMKSLILERGPIRYRDGNGDEYLADFVRTEKRSYPYSDAAGILDDWFAGHTEEGALREKLTISGLSSAIKAEKRSELARKLANVVDLRVETDLRIGRAANGKRETGQ